MTIYGKNLINDCMEILNLSETGLASLLNITQKTLINLKNLEIEKENNSVNINKLMSLTSTILYMSKAKIPNNIMLNLLSEPIDEEKSLLYYIVNEPHNSKISKLKLKCVMEYVDFGSLNLLETDD